MPERSKISESMLAITTGFVVLFLIFKATWLIVVAAVAGGIGLLSPWLSGWITKGWLKLAQALGWMNGRILLGLVFFVILTPVALLQRLGGGGKGLALKRDTGRSRWAVRDHTYVAADLEKPW